MSTYMSPVASIAESRKKPVTYGKQARHGTIRKSTPDDNAPFVERTHTHSSTAKGTLKRPGGNIQTGSAFVGAASKVPNIFDVPSDDEFLSATKNHIPTNLGTKEKVGSNHAARTLDKQTFAASKRAGQQLPSRRPLQQSTAAPRKVLSKPKHTPRAQEQALPTAIPETVMSRTSGQRSQSKLNTKAKAIGSTLTKEYGNTEKLTNEVKQANSVIKPIVSGTSLVRTSKATQGSHLNPLPTAKEVFNFPSSDDDSGVPFRLGSSKVGNKLSQTRERRQAQPNSNGNEHDESDDSNASRKRKRRGSHSSVSGSELRPDSLAKSSMPQRSRKLQRTSDSSTRDHGRNILPPVVTKPHVQEGLCLNKPKRTKTRTVPVLTHVSMAKGQSSPAMLGSMLPTQQRAMSSTNQVTIQNSVQEDETMYDIPHTVATPTRATPKPTSGSVTPRQKALFQDLLSNPISTTPVPNIASLQLIDRRPKSLIGGLTKSKSDLTDSSHVRKTRLISLLKPEESDFDSEDSDLSDDEGSETHAMLGSPRDDLAHSCDTPEAPRDMEATRGDSQTSGEVQATQTSARSKSTYAKARSYLEELNPEDAFLMSMDLDDGLGLDSQQQAALEDEEEQTSQVKGRHELRATGQQSAMSMEIEMSIDDISTPSNPSVRRTAMMDICLKLADKTFASQLLESSLAQRLLKNMTSTDEIVFDFASAAAIVFMLNAQPTYAILQLIYRSEAVSTLAKLLENDTDIKRIAKDRKSNLSTIAKDSVMAVRTLIQSSSAWQDQPERISPRILALKAFEVLIMSLREAEDFEATLSSEIVMKLIDAASTSCSEGPSSTDSSDNGIILELAFSTLESLSLAKKKQSTWGSNTLQHLVELLSKVLESSLPSIFVLAIKLCMNVTNNKPKACHQFSGPGFVQSLTGAVIKRFKSFEGSVQDKERIQAQESLILSLGALINLAEFSDAARKNIAGGHGLLEALVEIFVQGADQAAQAESIEESQYSVAIGFLSVLLGNLCLNTKVRSRIRTLLPGQRFDKVLSTINEFIRFHEHVDGKNGQYDGEEGQEALQNYTTRLKMVVQKLEKASS